MLVVINFKDYKEAIGKKAISLVKKLDKKNVWIIINAIDLKEAVKNAKYSKILIEHADPIEFGAFTGAISFPEVKKSGAYGILLNHSEKRIKFNDIKKGIILAKKYKLKVIVSSRNIKEALKIFITNPKLRLLSISNAITNSVSESTFVFAPVFVNTLWPIWAVGIMRSGNGFANAFSYFISGKVISRFKDLNALIGQFIASRIVLITAYAIPMIISPILMVFTSLIYGIGQVSQKTLLQKEFTDHQRATMGSLDSLLGSIMFAIVSVSIGYFADIIGPRNILLLGEILLLPVLFIYWRLFLHHKATV